jgi:hypothetical protein
MRIRSAMNKYRKLRTKVFFVCPWLRFVQRLGTSVADTPSRIGFNVVSHAISCMLPSQAMPRATSPRISLKP